LNASAPTQDAAARTVDRPFQDLFINLGRDVRALPSRDTLIVGVAGTAAALAMRPSDDNVSEWGRDLEHSQYARLGSWAGDGWVQGGVAVGTYAIGAVMKDAAITHVGSDLIRAQLFNGLTTRGLKIFVDRERPGGGGHSFPSGHSSAAFTTAAVLGAHYGWKAAVPVYALGGFVAWSRVRDGQHWLTDVVAGATLGTAIGLAVTRGHRASWSVVPAVSGTSTAVFVVKR
jgi:hypothetical protein